MSTHDDTRTTVKLSIPPPGFNCSAHFVIWPSHPSGFIDGRDATSTRGYCGKRPAPHGDDMHG